MTSYLKPPKHQLLAAILLAILVLAVGLGGTAGAASVVPGRQAASDQRDAGPPGAQGPAAGVSYRTTGKALTGGSWTSWSVDCPPGTQAIAGGVSSAGTAYYTRILESAPTNGGDGWIVAARNEGTASITVYGWAVCAAST